MGKAAYRCRFCAAGVDAALCPVRFFEKFAVNTDDRGGLLGLSAVEMILTHE
jgi:hypothetical protein